MEQTKKKYGTLDEIFNDDEFSLIEEKAKRAKSNGNNEIDRLRNTFQEINDFVKLNDREPALDFKDVNEYQLAAKLKGLRENPVNAQHLINDDIYKLLPKTQVVNEPQAEYKKKPEKEITSIDDIFEDDFLDDDDAGLFDFKHTPKEDTRAATDFVARRKPCNNFEEYKEQLQQVQKDLSNGNRRLVAFKQGNLRVGTYYVHNGILFYLESIDINQKEHYKEDGTRVREDGRTRCIFENGTESNMRKRSVEKILYANGKVVSENKEETNEEFVEKFNNISDKDKESGYIYVLKSLSEDAKISTIEHLYKIGFSKRSVTERIKDAEKEPTYLMAPVKIVGAWKCYNMNTQKFEQLIHNFFGACCLEADVFDENNIRHTPREWFIAPLPVIEQAVEIIISGEVVKYKYDVENMNIVER